MAVGEHFQINRTTYPTLEDSDEHTNANGTISLETVYQYSDSKVEFFYYQQPVTRKVEPTIGLTRGGTKLEISGAWFSYRPEYGVIPHCKIGDKIVRAHFVSSVRIVCVTPPSDDINVMYPVQVSLNGLDFVDTGFFFRYFE